MSYPTLSDISCAHRRVFLRADLNVPMSDGKVIDDTRIQKVLPSIRRIMQESKQLIIASHAGRPKAGVWTEKDSLAPVASVLSHYLGCDVPLVRSDFKEALPDYPIMLLENIRFLEGETSNDENLAKRMASCADVFVMDAFATAHRAHASCDAIARYVSQACVGPLFKEEVDTIQKVMHSPKRPLYAVVGGAKVSTKLPLLKALLDKVDGLIVGGGIANTFLVAAGYDVRASLYEPDYVELAKDLLKSASDKGVSIPLPVDVVVTEAIDQPSKAHEVAITELASNELIVDVGSRTQAMYAKHIQQAATVIWNGPLGIFEIPEYASGTQAMAEAIANSSAYSLAGGGDTLAALAQFDKTDAMSYISTGGGALLAVLQGQILPILKTLGELR